MRIFPVFIVMAALLALPFASAQGLPCLINGKFSPYAYGASLQITDIDTGKVFDAQVNEYSEYNFEATNYRIFCYDGKAFKISAYGKEFTVYKQGGGASQDFIFPFDDCPDCSQIKPPEETTTTTISEPVTTTTILEPKDMEWIEKGVLGIEWSDGHKGVYPVRYLRQHCPCAACTDEWTGELKLKPDDVPIFVAVQDVEPVGRYALKFTFSGYWSRRIDDQHRVVYKVDDDEIIIAQLRGITTED